MVAGRKDSQRVLAALKRYGLLLQTDARLPNVCALVTGAPVSGSWWAHPGSHDIFRVSCDLAEHRDVLVIKLVSSTALPGRTQGGLRPGINGRDGRVLRSQG